MTDSITVLVVTEDWQYVVDGGFLKWNDQPLADVTSTHSREFHLGEFISVLTHTHWQGFTLQLIKALRPTLGGNETADQLKARSGADVVNFHFDQPFTAHGKSWVLDDVDIVLFFPMQKGPPKAAYQSEVDAIARFMEAGGGFFATGDHEDVGATMCPLIPRVRSMRRWYLSQPGPNGEPVAPSSTGVDRIDTTQPGHDGATIFEDQSDDIAQKITPARYYVSKQSAGAAVWVEQWVPHPLLCSPTGVVEWLPDHMHEGQCEVPDKLGTRSFTLDGTEHREYPQYGSAPLAPEVVAWETVLSGVRSPLGLETPPKHTGGTEPTTFKTTGAIAAWDGHRVKRGRVVVDSTFHHFFEINLTGDRYLLAQNNVGPDSQYVHGFYTRTPNGSYEPNDQYKMIQWYFRNLVYWLIPAHRRPRIGWAALAPAIRRTGLIEQLTATSVPRLLRDLQLEDFFYFGSLGERYLRNTRGACRQWTVHVDLFTKPRIPWWEWIQAPIDVWDPVVNPTEVTDQEIRQRMFESAAGLRYQPATVRTLVCGAMLVSIAAARVDSADGDDIERIERHAGEIVQQVLGAYGTRMKELATIELETATKLTGATGMRSDAAPSATD